MKIDIAILDDEQLFCDNLKHHLKNWGSESQNILNISIFTSIDQFLTIWRCGNKFDMIFLDIVFPCSQVNGLDVAQVVRKTDRAIPIVLITSTKDYALDSYGVDAENYIVKPLKYVNVKECMTRVCHKISATQNSRFILKFRKTFEPINYNDILYFSSSNHVSELHMRNGEILIHTDKFQALSKELPDIFVTCNRGLIVNIEAIHTIDHQNILLTNGEQLPISKKHLSDVRKCFLLYFG